MMRHKFNAVRTEVDGIKFHSKKEASFYNLLRTLQKSGEIFFFLRQVPIHLPGGVVYRVDFVTFDADGSVHFIDVKGFKTSDYKMKKKMVEAMYPIAIEER